jgi:hypothetical protein
MICKGTIALSQILLGNRKDMKVSFVCEFSARTNSFNTKKTFLSVPVPDEDFPEWKQALREILQ